MNASSGQMSQEKFWVSGYAWPSGKSNRSRTSKQVRTRQRDICSMQRQVMIADKSEAIAPPTILLLGRRHQNADGVADYCTHLAGALTSRGLPTCIELLPWSTLGVSAAIAHAKSEWFGRVIILQYTAFSWSELGLPLWLLALLRALRRAGSIPGVMFHDPEGHPGDKLVHRARRLGQHQFMRQLASAAVFTVHNVPLQSVTWLRDIRRSSYIPVGTNILPVMHVAQAPIGSERTIAVFGVTGGSRGAAEIKVLRSVIGAVAQEFSVRLLVFGQTPPDMLEILRHEMSDIPAELELHGRIPSEAISRLFARSHCLLYARGQISTQRTTLLAALAHGVPVVGWRGQQTTGRICDAGIMPVPLEDHHALANAALLVLKDRELWSKLSSNALRAYKEHFSWEAIAEAYARLLRNEHFPP